MTRMRSFYLVASLCTSCVALKIPGALNSLERLKFQADREQEGLLRRAFQQISGDGLASLQSRDYALAPGSAVAITGASDGIGRAAAVFLAKEGFAPIVIARSKDKAEVAAQHVRQQAGAAARVASVVIDLADFASVERGGDAILAAAAAMDAPLRGLVCNAGTRPLTARAHGPSLCLLSNLSGFPTSAHVCLFDQRLVGMWPTERRISADGLQEGLQVCHVSHFQLCEALLPTMEAANSETRIVTVSSSAHALSPGVDLEDVSWERRDWDATLAYGESKCANLLFTQELAARHSPTSVAVHPGVVATSLFRDFGATAPPLPPLPYARQALETVGSVLFAAPPVKLLVKTPADGSRTLIHALLAPGVKSGTYLSDFTPTDTAPGASKDARARAELWEWTEAWVAAARSRGSRSRGSEDGRPQAETALRGSQYGAAAGAVAAGAVAAGAAAAGAAAAGAAVEPPAEGVPAADTDAQQWVDIDPATLSAEEEAAMMQDTAAAWEAELAAAENAQANESRSAPSEDAT